MQNHDERVLEATETEGEDPGSPQYDASSGDADSTENGDGHDGASDCTKCSKPVSESAATHGEALLPDTTSSGQLVSVVPRAVAALDAGDGAAARALLVEVLRWQ